MKNIFITLKKKIIDYVPEPIKVVCVRNLWPIHKKMKRQILDRENLTRFKNKVYHTKVGNGNELQAIYSKLNECVTPEFEEFIRKNSFSKIASGILESVCSGMIKFKNLPFSCKKRKTLSHDIVKCLVPSTKKFYTTCITWPGNFYNENWYCGLYRKN